MKRLSFVVLLVACGGSKETPVSPAVTPSAAPSESAAPVASVAPSASTASAVPSASTSTSAASTSTSAVPVGTVKAACMMPGLYAITMMLNPPREYALGSTAFDAATVDFNKHRYAAAARKFLDAAIHFAASGAVGEDNFGWSYKNAASAYEVAGQVKEGQAAFAAAAAADPTHAKVLQDRAAKIVDQRCP